MIITVCSPSMDETEINLNQLTVLIILALLICIFQTFASSKKNDHNLENILTCVTWLCLIASNFYIAISVLWSNYRDSSLMFSSRPAQNLSDANCFTEEKRGLCSHGVA